VGPWIHVLSILLHRILDESYNGIRVLADFSIYVYKYQQAFWRCCRGSNWRKDFDINLDVYYLSLPLAFVGIKKKNHHKSRVPDLS
jgi:hypothetical protein